jgi:lauroyl/myristoyl acyltransferase
MAERFWLGFILVRKERKRTIKNLTFVYGKEKTQEEIRRMERKVFVN